MRNEFWDCHEFTIEIDWEQKKDWRNRDFDVDGSELVLRSECRYDYRETGTRHYVAVPTDTDLWSVFRLDPEDVRDSKEQMSKREIQRRIYSGELEVTDAEGVQTMGDFQ